MSKALSTDWVFTLSASSCIIPTAEIPTFLDAFFLNFFPWSPWNNRWSSHFRNNKWDCLVPQPRNGPVVLSCEWFAMITNWMSGELKAALSTSNSVPPPVTIDHPGQCFGDIKVRTKGHAIGETNPRIKFSGLLDLYVGPVNPFPCTSPVVPILRSAESISDARIPKSVRYKAPLGQKVRSSGNIRASPLQSVRNTSTCSSIVRGSRPGWRVSCPDDAVFIHEEPIGRPILAITRLVRPSLVIWLTQPRSCPLSDTTQLESGKRTRPSGRLMSDSKIISGDFSSSKYPDVRNPDHLSDLKNAIRQYSI